jgi:hypothetical protein
MKTVDEYYFQLETYHQVNDPPMICLSPRALKATIKSIIKDTLQQASVICDETPLTHKDAHRKAILRYMQQI